MLIRASTLCTCLGTGLSATLDALLAQDGGLTPCRWETVQLDTCIGEVAGVDEQVLPAHLRAFDCRNNRLAQLGLTQDGFADAVRETIARVGRDRVGVFLGTSTSGILQSELAYRRRDPAGGSLPADFDYRRTQNTFSAAEFVREWFALEGPAFVVSSACSSSAKVFGNAARMIEAGVIDAAVVGGVDSLCLTTLYGFNSLELLSARPCRPFDAARDGISIGEAAAFALLTGVPDRLEADAVLLLGVGESSDAHHMSSPHPEGLGARLAMQSALDSAGLAPGDIDYINLHGTATQTNDLAEDKALRALFATGVPVSSTKGATGHALGAAGAVEAIIAELAIRHGLIPAGVNTTDLDPALASRYVLENIHQPVRRALSNSFGLGGTNCSLVLGAAQ